MSKFDDLLAKLKEIFQMDQADLDFGIYRIMNVRRDEITRFLENDLLPTVRSTLEKNQPAGLADKEKELADAIAQARKLKIDPDTLDIVKELKAELAQGVDLEKMEQDVYSDLTNFFSRYYHEGDFLSLRRYKEGLYAIPYEGEEVKLHWANADQYYIKSGENFSRYAFKTTKGRVRFELVSAATEQGDKKSANDKERCFILSEQPIFIESGDLVIPFEYRPDAEKRKQKELNTSCIENLLSLEVVEDVDDWLEWRTALATLEPTPTNKNRTLLERQLTDYTKSNKSDYFIHKNLGKFLRNELDFYIKNEIMFLDDISGDDVDAPKVESYLSRIKALRAVALKIITFLAQLENFQKKLWLKKKFVLESHYCITLDRIPEILYPQICEEAEIKVRVWSGEEKCQREEWVSLFAIDEIKADLANAGYSVPLTPEFLKSNPYLLIDTALFSADLKYRILAEIDNLDEQCDGLLVHSENFQALQLLQEKYRAQVKCIYIDPPYNTGNDGFPYKDGYPHSSWLSMVYDRIKLGKSFTTNDGAIISSIDENEYSNFRNLFDLTWGAENYISDMVWAAGRKNDSRLISISHEYMIIYARSREYLTQNKVEWKQKKKGLDDIYAQYTKLKKQFSDDYLAMTNALKLWYKNLADGHVAKAHKHYNTIDARGVYFPADISWPGGGGPRYEVLHPKTGKPVKIPNRGWITPDKEKMLSWIKEDLVHFGDDESSNPCLKSYLKDHEFQAPYSVFYQDGRAATKRLRQVIGSDDFGYPKDEIVISECIEMLDSKKSIIMDYFSGSGTTAHSVINLNRDDNGGRKYILVEQNSYFDNVLIPRIKKVIYSNNWKEGVPVSRKGISHCLKYIRLEGFEDVLNSLGTNRNLTKNQVELLETKSNLREGYLLNYMLDLETKNDLLNLERFDSPFDVGLRVLNKNSVDFVNVDMVETFNYLLGLNVNSIRALNGVHEVIGVTPQGDSVLILWRNVKEIDNDKLDQWFRKQAYNTRDREFDLIYVNGDNNLENLRRSDETWKVRLIEEAFHTLMFDVQDV